MIKKVIAVTLSMILAVSAGACGSSGTGSGQNSEAPQTAAEEQAVSAPQESANNDAAEADAPQEPASNDAAEADAPQESESNDTAEADAPQESANNDAAEADAPQDASVTASRTNRMIFKDGGVSLDTPASYDNVKDIYYLDNVSDYLLKEGISYTILALVPKSGNGETEGAAAEDPVNALAAYIGVRGDQKIEDVTGMLFSDAYIPIRTVEIGTVGDFTFYRGEYDSFQDGTSDRTAEITRQIRDELNAAEVSLAEPENGWSLLMGRVFNFQTKDLDGNPVSSLDLFAQNKVTMINIWTSWCGFCKDEMPELNKISKEYAAKGANVVGILYDSDEEGAIETGREVLSAAGVEYMNMEVTDVHKYLPISGFPTTIFVDTEGKICAPPVEGMNIQACRDQLDQLLEDAR